MSTTTTATTTTATNTNTTTTTTTIPPYPHIFRTYDWYFANQDRLQAELSAHCAVRPEALYNILSHVLRQGTFPHRDAFPTSDEEFEVAVKAALLAGSLEVKQAADALLAQEDAEELAQDLADEKAYQLKRHAELKERNAKRALQATPACEDAMPTRRSSSSKRACRGPAPAVQAK